jgi:hypothetical protein
LELASQVKEHNRQLLAKAKEADQLRKEFRDHEEVLLLQYKEDAEGSNLIHNQEVETLQSDHQKELDICSQRLDSVKQDHELQMVVLNEQINSNN